MLVLRVDLHGLPVGRDGEVFLPALLVGLGQAVTRFRPRIFLDIQPEDSDGVRRAVMPEQDVAQLVQPWLGEVGIGAVVLPKVTALGHGLSDPRRTIVSPSVVTRGRFGGAGSLP